MVQEINTSNLDALCKGTRFLGSGGGGDVDELRPIVEKALSAWGPVPVISPSEIGDEDYIVAIELIGAPIPIEKRHEDMKILIKPVLDLAMKELGRPIKALMPVEIGGSNALTPLCVAGEVGLPILDGDLLGRALPEITMISTNVFNMIPERVYIGDPETGIVRVMTCSSYADLEQKGRAVAASHASSAAVLIPVILKGNEAKRVVIPNTVSQSILIGQQKSVEELCQLTQGKVQFEGKIIDWSYEVKGGFLQGKLLLKTKNNSIFQVIVKNEYMNLLDFEGQIIAEAPEIISLLCPHNLISIQSDQICIGGDVICITCRGPELWYSERGLLLIQKMDETLTPNNYAMLP